jgi:hypothetical protein
MPSSRASWALEGRTPERDAVHVTGPCSRCPRMLAGRLQRRSTTLAPWMEERLPSASSSIRTGSGAALCRGLRASSRRSNRPTGQSNRQEQTHRWIQFGRNVRGIAEVFGLSTTNKTGLHADACLNQPLSNNVGMTYNRGKID